MRTKSRKSAAVAQAACAVTNDVLLTVTIPEPASVVIMGVAALGLVGRRRRIR